MEHFENQQVSELTRQQILDEFELVKRVCDLISDLINNSPKGCFNEDQLSNLRLMWRYAIEVFWTYSRIFWY